MSQPPEWFPDWSGQAAVIVASGPSAQDQPLELARGRARVIAVNTSWKLVPWADVLYGCDYAWWRMFEGCPDFAGLKLSIDTHAANAEQHPSWGVKLVRCDKASDRLLLERKNKIGWAANSGFGAVNLAAQFGVNKLILVGFDVSLHAGSHWHGLHPPRLGNPRKTQLARWRQALDAAAPVLAGAGISVYNTSPLSALKAYPKVTLEVALSAPGGGSSSG